MVKLRYIERACETTGHPSCPLVRGQWPELSTPMLVATKVNVVSIPRPVALPHAGLYPIDSQFKPKITKLIITVKRRLSI